MRNEFDFNARRRARLAKLRSEQVRSREVFRSPLNFSFPANKPVKHSAEYVEGLDPLYDGEAPK